MEMGQPCELHEIWPCAICNGDEARSLHELVDMDPVTPLKVAQFPGLCAYCGADFEIGTPIRFSPWARGWVAEGCCGSGPKRGPEG